MRTPVIDMEAFENAVHDWFCKETGMDPVVWRSQTAPQPSYPFGSLKRIAGPTALGGLAETRQSQDLDRPLGEEIELNTLVSCSITVSCQLFVTIPDSRNPAWDAESYLLEAQTSLFSDSICESFRYKGITVMEINEIQDLDEDVEEETLSRANLDVMFGVVLNRKEYVGYIKTVHIKSESLKVDRDFGVGV